MKETKAYSGEDRFGLYLDKNGKKITIRRTLQNGGDPRTVTIEYQRLDGSPKLKRVTYREGEKVRDYGLELAKETILKGMENYRTKLPEEQQNPEFLEKLKVIQDELEKLKEEK